MSFKEHYYSDIILSVITAFTGIASTLDNIEQIDKLLFIYNCYFDETITQYHDMLLENKYTKKKKTL